MCGLAGFFRSSTADRQDQHRQWLDQMGQAILHRGPDAGATFLDEHMALVHRRLSILDLSEAGTQPMMSASGRYVIVFNGEIYNFQALRNDLEARGLRFRTHTDTEVLLALFEQEGFRCLDKLNGMFAIAIWDVQTRELFLARDRLGKKPLYYYRNGRHFAFASEIKALMPLPLFERKIRYDAVKDFFTYQYVPDPKTIYENLHKLPPGHWLKTDGEKVQVQQYWDVSFAPAGARSPQQMEEELYQLISDAVRLRMVSDVPLGAFLSGGIDSSAIVGLMAGHSAQPVTTCSIGFDSERYDEVEFARIVANKFKTDHHEFTVRDNVADNLRDIARYFDEPFADPSFVPTYFVSRLARQKVTVALAGDGGDENFAGYSKYWTDAVENRLRGLFPALVRHALFPLLAKVAGRIPHTLGRKAESLLGTLSMEADRGFFVTNSFFRPAVWSRLAQGDLRKFTEGYDPADITLQYYRSARAEDHLSRILYTDIKTYLPGDILVKVDRMSMANSLETRAPLLDYRVVEYAASIPSALKLRDKEKKYILKKIFEPLLPGEILYRKKMGFSVPLAEWLRHEIRPLVEEVVSGAGTLPQELFDHRVLQEMWACHLCGNDQYTQELWTVLIFSMWWSAYCH